MTAGKNNEVVVERRAAAWMLPAALVVATVFTLFSTWALGKFLPRWNWVSLPLHSTLEMGGAVFGLVLAVIILFSQQNGQTSRRIWIACALIAMPVLDAIHSSVSVGGSFVWLHIMASLSGGLMFALVWFPDRGVSRATALATAGATLLVATLVGVLSATTLESLAVAVKEGRFTPVAITASLLGGGLFLLAAINFAVHYTRTQQHEEMLFLMVCLLFGLAGLIFPLSFIWSADWWLWHLLRFGGYVFAFWLMLLSYRRSQEEMIPDEVKQLLFYTRSLIEASVDPLVTKGPDGRITDVNAATEAVTGHSHDDLIGTDFSDYFTEPDKARAGYERAFREGSVRDYPLEIRRQDGHLTPVLYNASVYKDETGKVIGVFAAAHDITESKRIEMQLQEHAALKTGQIELADQMQGDPQVDVLCRNIITYLCKRLQAPTGLMYLAGEDGTLRLAASYAHKHKKHLASEFKPGEGLVGQAALEKRDIILADVPENYFTIESGLGEAVPRHIHVKPIVHNGKVKAVIELGTLHEFAEFQSLFLNTVAESIAIVVDSALNRTRLAKSLEESQALTEELQAQQEELRSVNEELEEQTQSLKFSEEKLKAQQEELQVTNEELEEKNQMLDRQKRDVEKARKDIEEQAEELALASKYKSEFLANMSHELRTPLNSLLLLSQSLAENKTGNLTREQVESARIIHGSGGDLLNLINEILDLSKIEAGRMDLQLGTVPISDLADGVRASFGHMTDEKGLKLEVAVRADTPVEMTSDRKRIEQVIRNLLSNAIKFTDSGGVTVTFARPAPGTNLSRSGLAAGACLAVAVKDTGIGIAPENQKIIFEAFQQVDGGTSRKYGGTGLGLSISRELTRLLGGEIQLESEPGKGSTFTLYLPVAVPTGRKDAPGATATITVVNAGEGAGRDTTRQSAADMQIEDDRDNLKKGDRVILVIEDDANFARVLYWKCREKDFKCLAAPSGEAGLELAAKHRPAAIILDILLPGMDGWAVLSALKENTSTRHIPVHIVSVEGDSTEAVRRGAVGYAAKPLSQEDLEETFRRLEQVAAAKSRRILLVEDDPTIRRETVKLIGDGDVKVDEAGTGEQALEALRSGGYDCVVLDLGLPDMGGCELLEKVKKEGVELPPVIVHTAQDLTRNEEADIRKHAESIVIKDVRSQERLLDEVSLFLHRVVNQMPKKKQRVILDLYNTDALLRDKKVLIVDDDMRTTFAISHILSERGMKPLKAENGERALRLLAEHPDVDLVLMDIMMPVMDGYEAMRRIRDQERFRRLPIIALTAKAMPEDREKCLAAGANDYLPKPLDQKRLVSMMRIWLCR